MGEHGIGDDAIVVAYDAGTIPFAARMVWMLRYYGHDAAYVLAGGYPAWSAAGFPTTTEPASPARATFTPRPRAGLRASRDDVLDVVEGRSGSQLVETQRDQTYAQRDRDITGAVRISGNQLLEDANGGRVADRATLERLVRDAGLDPQEAHDRVVRERRVRVGRMACAARSGFRRRRGLRRLVDGMGARRAADVAETVNPCRRRQRAVGAPAGAVVGGGARRTNDALRTARDPSAHRFPVTSQDDERAAERRSVIGERGMQRIACVAICSAVRASRFDDAISFQHA